jgi:Flp pilus assembly protein TadG
MMSRFYRSSSKRFTGSDAGQASVEMAFVVTLLLILICGTIDFGRALNDMQVMADLTRQGSNLASRGTSLAEAVQGVVSGESGLDLVDNGAVIISSVTNNSGVFTVTGQNSSTSDGLTKLSASSKIGAVNGGATLPSAYTTSTLQNGQTVFVTEVFYTFTPLTPIGALTNSAIQLPSTLYDVAYF